VVKGQVFFPKINTFSSITNSPLKNKCYSKRSQKKPEPVNSYVLPEMLSLIIALYAFRKKVFKLLMKNRV